MAPAASSLAQLSARDYDSSTSQAVAFAFDQLGWTLLSVGITSFFGGNSAVQGMTTVHLFEGRRWLGWYNTPGSHKIAKKYGRLADSPFWGGLFPGCNRDPTHLFGLNAEIGPYFVAAHALAGPRRSGFPAYLIVREAARVADPAALNPSEAYAVTTFQINPTAGKLLEKPLPRLTYGFALPALSSLTILSSFATCAMCAFIRDYWCFAGILWGIFASGTACFWIGSAQLVLSHPELDPGSPPLGNALLYDDKDIAVLRGPCDAVDALARGHFHVQFNGKPTRGTIGACSLLLRIQSIAQVLLVPQGTFFGQLMFVASLGVTWCFNAYLSALSKKRIQTQVLLGALQIKEAQRRSFGTRTAQVVYAVLALKATNPRKVLDDLLPNDTPAWRRWKTLLVRGLSQPESFEFVDADWNSPGLSPADHKVLCGLVQDAEDAWRKWKSVAASGPSGSEASLSGGSDGGVGVAGPSHEG
ncbi:hypothetical protein BC628DRAFT_671493 [Trametes gibbosa]|nr:hypothetical protein BC628DRAFT_671493 [Trametes gibbosa]